jgi:DNA repair protein RadA/Sms
MFICSLCSATSAKWTGKCPVCGEWNTFVESTIQNSKKKVQTGKVLVTQSIDLNHQDKGSDRYVSASAELDGVLGG